jgi:arginyl-tRNA synthetase
LREVIDEVGRDAARFIFLTRHYDSLILTRNRYSRPTTIRYYVHVHARILSIISRVRLGRSDRRPKSAIA